MTVFEAVRRFEKITTDKVNLIIGSAFVAKEKEVIHNIKGQLWDGKTGYGEDITPSYLDDPYFATREKALAYAKWKAAITKNSSRNFATPNLYINGFFYSSLFINNSFDVASNGFGTPIIEKYGEKTFVLDRERTENEDTIENLHKIVISEFKNILGI